MEEERAARAGDVERIRQKRRQRTRRDHATDEGAGLLSPEHLRDLVPDLDERDVFLCGPPAMIAHAEASLRDAGVARRHLHVERFAL